MSTHVCPGCGGNGMVSHIEFVNHVAERNALERKVVGYLSDLEADCAHADARKKKPTCKLMQGEVVSSTEELRRMMAVVRAAIRVAYATDLMAPEGLRSELDLREALSPFVTHDGNLP